MRKNFLVIAFLIIGACPKERIGVKV